MSKLVATLFVLSICSALPGAAVSAPADVKPALAAAPAAEPPAGLKGVWAAIAYSAEDGKHGFTWGAPKSEDAQHDALVHCERAGGSNCAVVTTFRNHWRSDETDDSGFPYLHCGALAKGELSSAWGVASAERRASAEEQALQMCKADGEQCKVVEWVCT